MKKAPSKLKTEMSGNSGNGGKGTSIRDRKKQTTQLKRMNKRNDNDGVESVRAVSLVCPQHLYNLPLFEVFLVVDCRSRVKYRAGHIASALNFPPPEDDSNETRLKSLEVFAAFASQTYSNERWDPIVIYGDEDPQSVAHIKWFVSTLQEFMKRKVQTGIWFIDCITARTTQLWVLDCPFSGFEMQYPMLCFTAAQSEHEENPNDSGASTMIPLPYHVCQDGDGIFIGSKAIKWSTEVLKAMNIQTVVLDDVTAPMFRDIQTTKPLKFFVCSGIQQLEDDKQQISIWNTTKLSNYFEFATEFIQHEVEANQRVLIQLGGRSHSAAIALAWFMRYYGWSFDQAKAHMYSCTTSNYSVPEPTTVLNPAMLFERELKMWRNSARFASYNTKKK